MPSSIVTRSLLSVALCALLSPLPALAEDAAPHEESAEIHWDYEGEGAPENWGRIKGEFRTCRMGQYQSPINIQTQESADLPPLDIKYAPAPLTILNNGHTVQVNYPQGSTMTVDGKVYELLQFHFHTPSEYQIDGKTYDMEVHFVHKRSDGALGVLGIMIEPGEQNTEAQKIWDHLPMQKADATTHGAVTIDASKFLPEDQSYFRLMGSLTTPPCTEGVNWHVLKTPIQFSSDQIQKFKQAFPMNARPIQPANNRLIIADR